MTTPIRPLVVLLALTVGDVAFANAVGPGLAVRQVAAPSDPLAGVKTISVGTFTGTSGSTVAESIRAALQDPERTLPSGDLGGMGKALLGVALGSAGELASSAAGAATGGIATKATGTLVSGTSDVLMAQLDKDRILLDDGLSIAVFELVGSGGDATITGSIDVTSADENYKAKQVKVDSKGNVVKNSKGETEYVEVDCTKRTVNATVNWTITGKASMTHSTSGSTSDSKCGSDKSKLASKDTLAVTAVGAPGATIVNTFAPAWRDLRIDMDKDKAIVEDLKLAKAGQPWMAACSIKRVLVDDSYNPIILYSMGGILEAMGHLSASGDYYGKAIAAKNHKGAAKSLARLKKRQSEVETLKSAFGMEYTVGEPDWDTCPNVPDGKKMMTKKGVELFSAASDGSKVATLPEGMAVYVVGEDGSMSHIALTDGTEGWLPTKFLK